MGLHFACLANKAQFFPNMLDGEKPQRQWLPLEQKSDRSVVQHSKDNLFFQSNRDKSSYSLMEKFYKDFGPSTHFPWL